MIRYNKLKELNLCDAYLIISDVNRYYITGFKSSFGYVIYACGKSYFLTDFRYKEEAESFFTAAEVEVIGGAPKDLKALVVHILSSESIKTIGFEDNRLSYKEYCELKTDINAEFIPVGEQIERLRQIKDSYELEQITAAQVITDKAFSKILHYIKPGITEKDICVELEYQMYQLGADKVAFDTIIASGSNSSRPHSSVSKRKISAGDLVILDFGAKAGGYCSDMTRTVAVGKPNAEMLNIYNVVLKAQTLALNALKAKLSCAEVFSIAKEYISANGYGKEFLHGLGHGVGLEIHEGPTLNNLSKEVFEPNMVVTVEPGIYINNAYGVRIEDMVVTEENGIKNLTVSTKELIIL